MTLLDDSADKEITLCWLTLTNFLILVGLQYVYIPTEDISFKVITYHVIINVFILAKVVCT